MTKFINSKGFSLMLLPILLVLLAIAVILGIGTVRFLKHLIANRQISQELVVESEIPNEFQTPSEFQLEEIAYYTIEAIDHVSGEDKTLLVVASNNKLNKSCNPYVSASCLLFLYNGNEFEFIGELPDYENHELLSGKNVVLFYTQFGEGLGYLAKLFEYNHDTKTFTNAASYQVSAMSHTYSNYLENDCDTSHDFWTFGTTKREISKNGNVFTVVECKENDNKVYLLAFINNELVYSQHTNTERQISGNQELTEQGLATVKANYLLESNLAQIPISTGQMIQIDTNTKSANFVQ